jgi:CxxC motif-containing protein (DUF1111 family)
MPPTSAPPSSHACAPTPSRRRDRGALALAFAVGTAGAFACSDAADDGAPPTPAPRGGSAGAGPAGTAGRPGGGGGGGLAGGSGGSGGCSPAPCGSGSAGGGGGNGNGFEDGEDRPGGDVTTDRRDALAFAQPAPALTPERRGLFQTGKAVFDVPWVAAPGAPPDRDGLGPLFNATSCGACHARNGRGAPPEPGAPAASLLLRVGVPLAGGGAGPEPTYGDQIQTEAVGDVPAEGRVTVRYEEVNGAFADGEPFALRRPVFSVENANYGPLPADLLTSARAAQPLVGLGLLAAIDAADIARGADPDDADGDGVSGRLNVLAPGAPGRFGWKANQPDLRAQNAGALLGDMGLSSPGGPPSPCTPAQAACLAAPSGGAPELGAGLLDALTFYTAALAVPSRPDAADPDVLAGKAVFGRLGCASCHRPSWVTAAAGGPAPELVGQRIWPYTDLLLHDVGDGPRRVGARVAHAAALGRRGGRRGQRGRAGDAPARRARALDRRGRSLARRRGRSGARGVPQRARRRPAPPRTLRRLALTGARAPRAGRPGPLRSVDVARAGPSAPHVGASSHHHHAARARTRQRAFRTVAPERYDATADGRTRRSRLLGRSSPRPRAFSGSPRHTPQRRAGASEENEFDFQQPTNENSLYLVHGCRPGGAPSPPKAMKNSLRPSLLLTSALVVLGSLAGAACGDDDDNATPGTSGAGGSSSVAGRGGGPSTSGGAGSPAGGAGGAATTTCGAPLPAAYDGTNFAANAADELAVVDGLKALTDAMKAGETNNDPPELPALQALFNTTESPLGKATTAYYAGRVNTWLATFAAIPAGSTWAPPQPPATDATPGKLVDWIFDQRGLDLRQVVEKGLYGAALYNRALGLTGGADKSPALVDKLVALFGARPAMPGDSDAAVAGESADRFSAQYAERRSPKDPATKAPVSGPYFEIKRALIAAQADAVKGAGCENDLAAQLTTFRQQWERSNFATVVFYMYDADKKLIDPAQQAAGLHSYGEAVGFVHGFRQLPAEGRVITDAQLDQILTTLKAPAEGQVDSYLFFTDEAANRPALLEVVKQLKTIYGFSDAEIEAFKTNN